jgi:hypothetical protein
MPKSLPISTGWNETFNVGIDTATSVDENDYQVHICSLPRQLFF